MYSLQRPNTEKNRNMNKSITISESKIKKKKTPNKQSSRTRQLHKGIVPII